MNLKFVEKLFLYRFRYAISYTALAVVGAGVLFFALNTLVPGVSGLESSYSLQSLELAELINAPINFFHRLLQWLSITFLGPDGLGVRAPSAVLGLVFLGLIFSTVNIWHKKRIAIVATGLAATSSWFLHSARLGTDVIMLPLAVALLIFTATSLNHSKQKTWQKWLTMFSFAVILYTPLMVYLLLLFLFLYRNELNEQFLKQSKNFVVATVVVAAILVAPLLIALVRDPDLIVIWLGIPESLPSIGMIFSNINDTFAFMFWRAEDNAVLHLGNLPMLEIFTATMTALGLYHYERHGHHLRTRFVMGGFFASLAIVSFVPNQANYAILMPFIFIFAATGVVTLLTQWYMIFPRNPIARASAIIPMAILLLSVSGYHIERYFFAWSKNTSTFEVFPQESRVSFDLVREGNQPALFVTDTDRYSIVKLAVSDNSLTTVITADKLSDVDISQFVNVYTTEGLALPKQSLEGLDKQAPIETESVRRPKIFEHYTQKLPETDPQI